TVGTSSYMSPEQVSALPSVDTRSDIYSLGCLLYECLAGKPPFYHRNESVVLQLQLTAPQPDIRLQRPETPAPLAEAIFRAMAKEPDARWQTAGEMRDRVMEAAAPSRTDHP
ncbi:MAG: protein kinase, partial [Gemmatimonadales bacterium]